MEATNPFAQVPTTPEPIIAQVHRQLADDVRLGPAVPRGEVGRIVERTVRELWDSRVKTFVPVLALRQAREILLEQDRVLTLAHPSDGQPETGAAASPSPARAVHDVLAIPDDVMRLDERDVLSL